MTEEQIRAIFREEIAKALAEYDEFQAGRAEVLLTLIRGKDLGRFFPRFSATPDGALDSVDVGGGSLVLDPEPKPPCGRPDGTGR